MRQFFLAVTRNVISLIGAALTTASAMLILCLFGIEQLGYRGGPYLGIITFVILPALFLLGLLLVPIGMWHQRRRVRFAHAQGAPSPTLPVIDLNLARTRKGVLIFVGLTMVNLVILTLATYKSVEVMESTAFCGNACHTVMAPEYTAYQRSPHAHVKCVSCHAGPGASGLVKSKMSGSWQLLSVSMNLYPRPIPAPVHSLPPSSETCEDCHWPARFSGDRLKVIARYAEDEANTERKTVLAMHVGGTRGGTAKGIHWHADPSIRIRYRSDPSRTKIGTVELKREDGTVELYKVDEPQTGIPKEGEAGREKPEGGASTAGNDREEEGWRTMDCVDCHNRPAHTYQLPRDGIDAAIEQGRIDRSLPFIRREGMKALQAEYASHEQARAGIAEAIKTFYRSAYPDILSSKAPVVETALRTLGDIYCANVFPWMKVAWGTYPNHLGHESSLGCWRCHDEMHKTASGKTISQDCSVCHAVLANEEEKPEILQQMSP